MPNDRGHSGYQLSTNDHQLIIRSRIVLPITAPPIENGAVIISGNRVRAVGSWPDLKSQTTADDQIFDLGKSIVLPGLINSHCHLDYTDMAGLCAPPKRFTDWIPQMLAAKAAWSYADYATSWLAGAKMLLQSGTTTVADIEAVPELLPDLWDATPLRVISFLEMTGVRLKRDPKDILDETLGKIASLSHPRSAASLSPHAPYSTSPELLRLCARAAREKHLRIATHVAESEEEFEMFAQGRGKMFTWLQRNERDMGDCGAGTPVQHLERAGLLGENLIAIHANALTEGDIQLLGRNRCHIVHCPQSHDYFQHPRFQRQKITDAGANVALGTDSLATTRKTGSHAPRLNLFDEMRALAANDKSITAKEILQMATVNGALALGLAGKTGQISENAAADLIAIPFTGKVADSYDAVVHLTSTISAGMVDGSWAIAP